MSRKFETLKRAEKERIIEKLNNQFGIKNLPYLLIRHGRERIRAFSGSLSREELEKLGENINIELVGIYLGKEEHEGIRLSHDAPSILHNQITKNIIELTEEQAKEWLKGRDLEIKSDIHGFVILKYNEFLIGCGKSSGERITNFVPKERRVK